MPTYITLAAADGTAIEAADVNTPLTALDTALAVSHNADGSLKTGIVAPGKIAAGAVGTSEIADGTVTTSELGASSVVTGKIADANVTAAKLASDAVTTAKILDANVTTAKLADANVTTAKIADANVTTAKIADANVTTAKIAAGAVTNTELGTGAVTTGKIVDGAVITQKITDANVTTAKIADGNVTTAKIATGAVTANELGAAAVSTGKVADAAITTAKIADANVTTAKLADANVTTAKLADANVTTAKLAAGAVTSNELGTGAVITGKVVDAAIITQKIADANITGAKLSATAVDPVNVVWAPDNGRVQPDRSFNGRRRFFPLANAAASLVLETTPNAYGSYTLRLVASSPDDTGGKLMYPSEMQVVTGDQIMFKARVSGASGGSTYVVGVRCHKAGDTVVAGTTIEATITPDDTAHDYALGPLTITSDTIYVLAYVRRVSGTGSASIYFVWGSKGQYAAATPPKMALPSQDGLSGRPGIVYDPTFKSVTPGTDVSGIMSWVVPQDLTAIWGDTNNPFGGATIRMADTANKTAGKRFRVGDGGTVIGDIVAFAAVANSASGNLRLNCAFYDSSNTIIGSATAGPIIASNGTAQYFYTTPAVIPNTTVFITVYLTRTSGSGTTDIYAMWGGKDGICDAAPMLAPIPNIDREYLPLLATFGKERMQDWQSQCAKMQLNLSTTQTSVVCLGDSWMGHSLITTPLRSALQTTWGDAGFGYVDFYNTFTQSTAYREAVTTGAGTARTGTWTDTDHAAISPTGKGPGLTDIRTSDIAATLSLQTSVACTAIDIWAYQQVGGGTYEYRIDGGSWTAVDTDAAAGLKVTAITGLSNAVHLVEIRVSVVGSQGVILLGLNLKKATAGVIVHNLGTNGTTSAEWVAVGATLWEAELTALAPNVVIIQLMTNDRSGGVVPTVFGANIQTLIDRIRVAAPLCDVILESAADRLSANTGFTLTSYISTERDIASRNFHVGFVSAHEAIGPRDDAGTGGRELWGDASHLNSIGFRVLANQFLRYLAVV